MGTRNELKTIGARLLEAAASGAYPDEITPATFQDRAMRAAHDQKLRAQRKTRATFSFGTLTISCVATRQAVEAMGRKFVKGWTPRMRGVWRDSGTGEYAPFKMPTMRRPPDADARLAALADAATELEEDRLAAQELLA